MSKDELLAVTLKPCPSPWCDHSAFVAKTDSDWFYGKAFQGRCTQCGMGGPVERTEAEAITAWNTRQNDPEKQALKEALTPSGDTKAAYIGEFQFPFTVWDPTGEFEITHTVTVPWTTTKEIMAAIRKRARIDALINSGEAG